MLHFRSYVPIDDCKQEDGKIICAICNYESLIYIPLGRPSVLRSLHGLKCFHMHPLVTNPSSATLHQPNTECMS